MASELTGKVAARCDEAELPHMLRISPELLGRVTNSQATTLAQSSIRRGEEAQLVNYTTIFFVSPAGQSQSGIEKDHIEAHKARGNHTCSVYSLHLAQRLFHRSRSHTYLEKHQGYSRLHLPTSA
jgi:hypothetical protein